ncbi:unnamed protein product [Pleuronectes platessa]|uniref:Uncharacterized protein n=1 Tax=Pleuronectes platessa TaxID=8262 RepID=A0A9N7VC33_PLEPL|nr:unnamed protein product [Pleuronectes platessa]
MSKPEKHTLCLGSKGGEWVQLQVDSPPLFYSVSSFNRKKTKVWNWAVATSINGGVVGSSPTLPPPLSSLSSLYAPSIFHLCQALNLHLHLSSSFTMSTICHIAPRPPGHYSSDRKRQHDLICGRRESSWMPWTTQTTGVKLPHSSHSHCLTVVAGDSGRPPPPFWIQRRLALSCRLAGGQTDQCM